MPGRGRFFFLKADFHHGLDALITVLPGNDHANRRTVLRRKGLAVHPDAKKSERVHGFVQTQTFDIGKIYAAILRLGHLTRVIESLKCHVASLRRELDQLYENAEGKT